MKTSTHTPEHQTSVRFPDIPEEYLREAAEIPDFWITSLEDIAGFLNTKVAKGTHIEIGASAGGRPIRGVAYGTARSGKGTTTFSGSIGCRNVDAYFGKDAEKRVYLAMGGVHASEYEGITGIMNLISILETGSDLRNKPWPDMVELIQQVDRVLLVPIVNVDGRARIPQRMFPYRGRDNTIYQYFGTGGNLDGSNIGWPACKNYIPMDFADFQYPGGYPNDAGVNIQHDDFFSSARQPETEALFQLCAQERPDLILNMHTGAPPSNYFTRMHRPYCEPVLEPIFDEFYRRTHTALTEAGCQSSRDASMEADPTKAPRGCYNLDTALNLHCGALVALIEAPCHGFSGTDRKGNMVERDLDNVLDAQLICHREALRFLVEQGGRCVWTPGK